MIHRRFGVVSGNDFMHPAVTVLAIRRRSTTALACLRMRTVRVCVLCIRVTLHTRDLLRRSFVNQAFYVLVAIHATEHRGMNGMLQPGLIDIQADLFAILIFRQR